MKTLVLATTNQGKLKEFQILLKDLGIELKTLSDYPEIEEIEETGSTFTDNALIKAKTVAEYTGHLTLADDSGLVVPYLKGEPGIYSARYAGEEKNDKANNDKLLANLKDVPENNRLAYFECAIALCDGKGYYENAIGRLEGRILTEERGENGFGYDPLFYLEDYQKTSAELDITEKNKISHRGQAVKKAIQLIEAYFVN